MKKIVRCPERMRMKNDKNLDGFLYFPNLIQTIYI